MVGLPFYLRRYALGCVALSLSYFRYLILAKIG